MPLASTCSAAISAACHRPDADKEAHLLPVQWGVICQDDFGRDCCSFTTFRGVVPPTPGMDYLGIAPKPTEKKKRWFSHPDNEPNPEKQGTWKALSYVGRLLTRADPKRKKS